MKDESIVNYIEHYLDKDITKGAIMLTGAWGTGKSHFIQNTLIPKLQETGKDCAVVSLYGLKNVTDISKSIYFELKTGFLRKDNEVITTGILTAKTVLRGVTSFFGVDLKASDAELQKLYESVDLSGKLIILEDIERCQIGILELLGFVNNLVEQDGVKVLLVANEKEFLKYCNVEVEEKDPFGKSEKKVLRKPTNETEQYLRVKEKTVNDTIQYECDFLTAISNIIKKYDNKYLSKFIEKDVLDNILGAMNLCGCYNLRSLIYVCQKTVDILEKIPIEYLENDEFLKSIFFGNLFFIFKVKSGKELSWGSEKIFSIELGHPVTPLFKFCYDYITKQTMDLSLLDESYTALIEKNQYDKNKSNGDADIEIIQNYHIHSEKQVRGAIDRIKERLKNPDDISFYMYGTIAVYLIIIKQVIECDIEEIKRMLVDNLKGRGNKLQIEHIFRTIMDSCACEACLKEYQELRKAMVEALKEGLFDIPGFDYLPEQVNIFCEYVSNNEGNFHINEGFARYLNIEKFAYMFSKCSLEKKDDIRGAFLGLYRSVNIGQLLGTDLEKIKELKALIEELADKCTGDKIEKLQYSFFIDNLAEIVEKLSLYTT